MTQLPYFDEQAVAQSELEQYINQQAFLVAVEKGASYSVKSSAKSFLPGDNKADTPVPNQATSQLPAREPLKHLLIGSPKAVTSTIHYLYQLGYAQVNDWSPLLPSPANPGEVMSILVRQILVQ